MARGMKRRRVTARELEVAEHSRQRVRGVLSPHNEDVVLDVGVVLVAHHLTDALNGI